MISFSTPFSLETASTTIRISLFIVRPPDSQERSIPAPGAPCVLPRSARHGAGRPPRPRSSSSTGREQPALEPPAAVDQARPFRRKPSRRHKARTAQAVLSGRSSPATTPRACTCPASGPGIEHFADRPAHPLAIVHRDARAAACRYTSATARCRDAANTRVPRVRNPTFDHRPQQRRQRLPEHRSTPLVPPHKQKMGPRPILPATGTATAQKKNPRMRGPLWQISCRSRGRREEPAGPAKFVQRPRWGLRTRLGPRIL